MVSGCGEARLSQKKMYFDAIRFYREAIQIDSSFAQAYNNLGIVYAKTGELEKAVDVYNKSLENDPEFVDAYYNRSNAPTGLSVPLRPIVKKLNFYFSQHT